MNIALPTPHDLEALDKAEAARQAEIQKRLEDIMENSVDIQMDTQSNRDTSVPDHPKLHPLPPVLRLPSQPSWGVLVLGTNSDNLVIVRLVETSEMYMNFLDKLAAYYDNSNSYFVGSVKVGRIYAALGSENTVLRVQAELVEENTVRCLFVDEGGAEDLDISCLREIPEDVIQIPFQAFKVKLHNLGDYEYDERVAKLINRRIDHEEGCLTMVVEPQGNTDPIEVVLWDTAGENDVQMNQRIVNLIQDSDLGYIKI